MQLVVMTVHLKESFPLMNHLRNLNISLVIFISLQLLKTLLTQPEFTCSKLAMKTLEKGVKYVNNKDNRMTPMVSLLLTFNIIHALF